MSNTLGNLYHIAPRLQDKDILNVTLLTFADIGGQTYSVTPDQLKVMLGISNNLGELNITDVIPRQVPNITPTIAQAAKRAKK